MTKITKTGPNGLKLIQDSEGWSATPYPDPATGGIPYTIGYGSTFYEDGTKVKLSDPTITKDRGTKILQHALKSFEQHVDAMTRDDINQNQFDALISLCYNIGPNNLKTSTILRLVNANPSDPAIKKAFLMWNKANGKVMKGLTTRRNNEANLYFS